MLCYRTGDDDSCSPLEGAPSPVDVQLNVASNMTGSVHVGGLAGELRSSGSLELGKRSPLNYSLGELRLAPSVSGVWTSANSSADPNDGAIFMGGLAGLLHATGTSGQHVIGTDAAGVNASLTLLNLAANTGNTSGNISGDTMRGSLYAGGLVGLANLASGALRIQNSSLSLADTGDGTQLALNVQGHMTGSLYAGGLLGSLRGDTDTAVYIDNSSINADGNEHDFSLAPEIAGNLTGSMYLGGLAGGITTSSVHIAQASSLHNNKYWNCETGATQYD